VTSETHFKKYASYEIAVYLLLAIVAVLLRFYLLGNNSLSDKEAANALQALNLSRGENTIVSGQAGYVGLTTALFTLFGANNFWARMWPALFGSLLPFVPFLFRKYLQTIPALVLGVLIAIDPVMISLSRTASGSIIGITCFLAGLGFLIKKRTILASLSWGLSLMAGPDIWIAVLVFTASYFAFRKVFSVVDSKTTDWKKLIIPGAVLVVVISTLFLISPNGVSGIGSSFADYFRTWHTQPQIKLGNFIIEFFIVLFPQIIFGLIGIVKGFVSKDKFIAFLATWLGLGLIFVLNNPSRNLLDLGWIEIPLLALAAVMIGRFVVSLRFENKWIAIGEIFFSFLMIIMSAYYLLNLTNNPEVDPILFRNKLLAVLLPILLLIAITALFSWGWNSPSAKNGLFVTLCGLGILLILSGGWKATGWTTPIEKQLWTNGSTVMGEKLLMSELADMGRWTSGQANGIHVEVAGLNSPSLDWALRNAEKVIKSEQINQNTVSEVLLTPSDMSISTNASYRGQKITWSQKPESISLNVWGWIKLMVYHQAPMQAQDIILWVRNDIFK
jgi:hypothetical protein